MADYWLGMATIPALLVFAAAVYAAWAGATRLWSKWHIALLNRVDLARNPYRFNAEGDGPEYIESANKVRDALLKSPRFWQIAGFGFILLIVRDWKEKSDG